MTQQPRPPTPNPRHTRYEQCAVLADERHYRLFGTPLAPAPDAEARHAALIELETAALTTSGMQMADCAVPPMVWIVTSQPEHLTLALALLNDHLALPCEAITSYGLLQVGGAMVGNLEYEPPSAESPQGRLWSMADADEMLHESRAAARAARLFPGVGCYVAGCLGIVQVRCAGCRKACCQQHNQVTQPFGLGGTAMCGTCYTLVIKRTPPPALEAAMAREDNDGWPEDQIPVLPF